MLRTQITAAQLVAGSELSTNPDDEDNVFKAKRAALLAHVFLSTLTTLEEAAQESSENKVPTVPFETMTLTT